MEAGFSTVLGEISSIKLEILLTVMMNRKGKIMEFSDNKTRMFSAMDTKSIEIASVLKKVSKALDEKGYRPLDQIVGYLVSGDPSYITSHNDARILMTKVDRNELLEEIVSTYLKNLE